MNTYTAEQITAIGGNEWIKGGKHRVYINQDVWSKLIGLDIQRYKSGNISSATLDGVLISNSEAKRILGAIDSVWLDVATGLIHIRTYMCTRPALAEEVCAWIRDGIAKAVAELGRTDDEPTADSADVASTVDRLRRTGRTVRQIAAEVGVSVTTVYRWARGICRPRPTNLAALTALA